ncbi:MAG: UDP-N-acetylmuramate dehydrogenase [Eubacterium sp.]|nr:UDP-N-acetylmuramate dehydrogenase [Eubacterium sp.]
MEIAEQEPMRFHTTFRTGGPARWFCPVSSVSDILDVLRFADEKKAGLFVIGKGSNLLVSDDGLSGVVMEIGDGFRKMTVDGDRIIAEAGASLSAVAAAARNYGLSGLEFASGIPGTLGGGISMNAGAYDGEMKDVVESVDVIRKGELLRLNGEEMHFSYRSSRCHEEELIITGAVLHLTPGDPAEIGKKMQELNERRREKQPLKYPSAGSTFKRPEGYFAGKLIQDAGLKGYSVGDAQVSEKHAGFVINRGNASSEDIYRLIMHVVQEVEKNSGVRLEPEVRIWGSFSEER